MDDGDHRTILQEDRRFDLQHAETEHLCDVQLVSDIRTENTNRDS